jgi:hypothetical protein
LIDIVTDAMVFGLSRLDHWTILMLSKRTRDTSFSRSWTGHRMSGPCAICWASSVPDEVDALRRIDQALLGLKALMEQPEQPGWTLTIP